VQINLVLFIRKITFRIHGKHRTDEWYGALCPGGFNHDTQVAVHIAIMGYVAAAGIHRIVGSKKDPDILRAGQVKNLINLFSTPFGFCTIHCLISCGQIIPALSEFCFQQVEIAIGVMLTYCD